MASPSDLINIIGVPLAVLGVMPLLYNAVLCLYIYYKLSQSTPGDLRHYFKLRPNPANGTVRVVVQHFQLTPRGLWENSSDKDMVIIRKRTKRLWHRAFHRAFHRTMFKAGQNLKRFWDWLLVVLQLCGTCRCDDVDIELGQIDGDENRVFPSQSNPEPPALLSKRATTPGDDHAVSIRQPKYLFCTWMNLLFDGGFEICPPPRSSLVGRESISFTVYSDLQTAPTPLQMNSGQFIWFALGMGATAQSLIDLKDKTPIAASSGCTFRFSRREDGWLVRLNGKECIFSLREALAASLRRLVPVSGRNSIISHVGHEAVHVLGLEYVQNVRGTTFTPFEISPESFVVPESMRFGQISPVAFRWAVYCREHRRTRLGELSMPLSQPVSHALMNAQMLSLYFVYKANESGSLRRVLREILGSEEQVTDVIDVITEQWHWLRKSDGRNVVELHQKLDYAIRGLNGETILRSKSLTEFLETFRARDDKDVPPWDLKRCLSLITSMPSHQEEESVSIYQDADLKRALETFERAVRTDRDWSVMVEFCEEEPRSNPLEASWPPTDIEDRKEVLANVFIVLQPWMDEKTEQRLDKNKYTEWKLRNKIQRFQARVKRFADEVLSDYKSPPLKIEDPIPNSRTTSGPSSATPKPSRSSGVNREQIPDSLAAAREISQEPRSGAAPELPERAHRRANDEPSVHQAPGFQPPAVPDEVNPLWEFAKAVVLANSAQTEATYGVPDPEETSSSGKASTEPVEWREQVDKLRTVLEQWLSSLELGILVPPPNPVLDILKKHSNDKFYLS